MKSLVGGGWVGGGCYWYVKIPLCEYMEHGLEYITFYVQKHMASLQVCCGLPLVRDKPLGAAAFVKLAYCTELVSWDGKLHRAKLLPEPMTSFSIVPFTNFLRHLGKRFLANIFLYFYYDMSLNCWMFKLVWHKALFTQIPTNMLRKYAMPHATILTATEPHNGNISSSHIQIENI